MRPVIFIAFSNDRDQYLDSLKEESRSLERILRPLHQKEVLELYIKENINNEDIYDSIIAHDNNVMIFHYAGHAGSENLLLDGQEADALGLAELFSTQKEHLKLVFLNGCSTSGQVEQLLSLGIPAVIATSQNIPDQKASKFAKLFYQALVRNNTLSQAFTKAASFLKAQYSENASVFRKIDFSFNDEGYELPWGLYLKEGNNEILRWKLPQFVSAKLNISHEETPRYKVNQYLEEILTSMQKFDPSINATLKNLDRTDYLNTVIERLPYPIAVQFQKLVSSDLKDLNIHRLNQIISTYYICSKLIYFILLSQLWEEQHSQSLRSVIDLENWRSATGQPQIYFDYALASNEIFEELKKNGVPIYLKEFEGYLEEFERGPLQKACEFLQESKSRAKEFDSKNSYSEFCERAEKCLSIYLKATSFLVVYELFVIRDVYLHKPRYENEIYKHRYALLKLSLKDSISVREKPLDSLYPTENNSVILLKKYHDGLDDYLSLSPFVIDKNAFSTKNDSEIFFMSHKQDNDIIYHRVKSSIYKALKDKDDQIHTQNNQDEGNSGYLNLVQKQVDIFESDFNLA